jgi:hypothetical protein
MHRKFNLPLHPARWLAFLPSDFMQSPAHRPGTPLEPDRRTTLDADNVSALEQDRVRARRGAAERAEDDPATIEQLHRALYATTRSRFSRNRRGRIR